MSRLVFVQRKKDAVTVLGPENNALPSVSMASDVSGAGAAASSKSSAEAATAAAAAAAADDSKRAKRSKKHREDESAEPTIEERVAALTGAVAASSQPASAPVVHGRGDRPVAGVLPTADSLQAVLVQALHTDDANLLEYCLSTRNTKMIERTIDRLPTPFVLPFLTRVIDKFQSTPSRGQALITWIKEILTRHAAYLLSVPTLTKSLTGLYSVMDARLSVFKKLLKLSGRLDLLLAQVEVRQRATGAGALAVTADAGVVYYEDEEGMEVADGDDADAEDDEVDAELDGDADLLSEDDE